jgi:hypothetical protein
MPVAPYYKQYHNSSPLSPDFLFTPPAARPLVIFAIKNIEQSAGIKTPTAKYNIN